MDTIPTYMLEKILAFVGHMMFGTKLFFLHIFQNLDPQKSTIWWSNLTASDRWQRVLWVAMCWAPVAVKQLRFRCFASTVKDATSLWAVPSWGMKCGRTLCSDFLQRRGEDMWSITRIHRCCFTKHCKSKALWVRRQYFLAHLFLLICTKHFAISIESRSLSKRAHLREWHL